MINLLELWIAFRKNVVSFVTFKDPVDIAVNSESPSEYFEVYKSSNKEWRWRFKAGNHKIVATSGESFSSYKKCIDSINILKKSAAVAVIINS